MRGNRPFVVVLMVAIVMVIVCGCTTPSGGGELLWTEQFGTTEADDGRIAVAGFSRGNLGAASEGGYPAFVLRGEGAGGTVWSRQFGSPETDVIDGLAVGSDGRVLMAGTTRGVVQGTGYGVGVGNAFVRTFHANGDHAWTRQFGTATDDGARAIAIRSAGEATVFRNTGGTLEGTSSGGDDVFLRAYGP